MLPLLQSVTSLMVFVREGGVMERARKLYHPDYVESLESRLTAMTEERDRLKGKCLKLGEVVATLEGQRLDLKQAVAEAVEKLRKYPRRFGSIPGQLSRELWVKELADRLSALTKEPK